MYADYVSLPQTLVYLSLNRSADSALDSTHGLRRFNRKCKVKCRLHAPPRPRAPIGLVRVGLGEEFSSLQHRPYYMQKINLLSLFLVFSFVADVSCFFSDKINLISTKYQCCYCESENITAPMQADTHNSIGINSSSRWSRIGAANRT